MITKTAKRILLAICAALAAVCALFAISFKPMPTKASTTTSALTEVTMNRVAVQDGKTAEGVTVDYVSFGGFEEGKAKSTFFLVDFYGSNVPNFAVNATQGYSTWTGEGYASAGITLLQSWENASNTGSQYALCGNNGFVKASTYATLQTSSSAGVTTYEGTLTPGMSNYTAGVHYIMLVGFEPGSETATAYATYSWYVFQVDDATGKISLVGKMLSSRNTPAAKGQYAVIYPNILAGSETITFSYATPKASVKELISGLDGVAYQEQLMSAFGMELPSGLTSATMDRVNVTSDGSASGVDSITFDGFGSTFSSTFFLVDFYGQNVPNFAVNAKQAYDVWDSNATYATAGIGLSLSNNGNDTYDSEELRVSDGVYGVCKALDYYGFESAGEQYIIEQEGIKPGLLRLSKYENTHYVMILGIEPTCDTTYPQFIWYLFEENGGVLTQVGKLIASKNTTKPTGNLAVIYPNVNEGPEQITFQYAQPATTLQGVIEGLGNGCAYKQQLIDLFIQESTYDSYALASSETTADNTYGNGEYVESISFDGFSGSAYFLVDFTGRNCPNFAFNATAVYSQFDQQYTASTAGNMILQGWGFVALSNGVQSADYYYNSVNTTGNGLARFSTTENYVVIAGYDQTNNTLVLHLFTYDATTGSVSNIYSVEKTHTRMLEATGDKAVVYSHASGGANNSVFNLAKPADSMGKVINNVSASCVYKDSLLNYFSLAKTLTVQDESGNTISTEKFVGSVQLPASNIENFIGWTYTNAGKTELYPANGVIEAATDVTVKATTLDLTMEEGAAARIASDTNGVGGIRFTVRATTEKLAPIADFVNVYGVLIATDMIDGSFDNDETGAAVKALENSVADGTDTVWYITFTNILYFNYNREFSAKAYAEIEYADGTKSQIATDYTAKNNSRSVYDIAVAACNDTTEYNKLGSAQKAVLHTYVGYTVNLSYEVNGTKLSAIATEDGLADGSLRKYSVVENSLTAEANGTGVEIRFTDLPESLISASDDLPHVPVTLWIKTTGEKSRIKVSVESYSGGVAKIVLPMELDPTYYYGEDKEFVLYSYHAVSNGTFTDDDVPETVDPNGQTLEDTKQYQEAGFNVIKIADPFWNYNDTTWLKSDLKDIMDQAQSLGLKCIVSNPETTRLTETRSSLIVTDGSADGVSTFASQSALNAYIAKQIKDIVEHEAFYGLALDDEPAYTQFAAIGEVYTAIKACAPDAFVMVNLLPYSPGHVSDGKGYYSADEQTIGAKAAYNKYLQAYYDAMGQYTNHLQYDDYPIRENETESYILDTHLVNAQMVAEFCKVHDLIFDKVFQTCAGGTASKLWRAPTETDMYWQTNIGMAMGVKMFSYWSYYPVRNVTEEYYDETASFVNKKGEKNDLYTWMQDIHQELQAMADVLSWFDWQGMNVYKNGTLGDVGFLNQLGTTNYTYAENVTVSLSSTGAALVSESYDEVHAQYGYFVTNVTDPTQTSTINVTVTFAGSSNVIVYKNGVATKVALSNGSTTITLTAGEGVFVLPY